VLFTGSPCYAEPFWRRDRDIFDNKTSRLCYPCSSDRCTNLHKETKKNFSHVIKGLYNYVNPKTRQAASMIPKETYDVVMANAKTLDSAIIYERDFRYNLYNITDAIPIALASVFLLAMYQAGLAEQPQHLILRVAVDIVHGSDVEGVLQTLASTIQPH
ncbi:hypothetical protein BGW80DRAFT_1518580, partial [Lactifluus volemus]